MDPYGGKSNATQPGDYEAALNALGAAAAGTLHGPPSVACLLAAQALSREELRERIPQLEEAAIEKATLRDDYLGDAGLDRALVANLRLYAAVLIWMNG